MKIAAFLIVVGSAGMLFAAADGLPGRLPPGLTPGVYRDDADYLLRKFRSDVTDPLTEPAGTVP